MTRLWRAYISNIFIYSCPAFYEPVASFSLCGIVDGKNYTEKECRIKHLDPSSLSSSSRLVFIVIRLIGLCLLYWIHCCPLRLHCHYLLNYLIFVDTLFCKAYFALWAGTLWFLYICICIYLYIYIFVYSHILISIHGHAPNYLCPKVPPVSFPRRGGEAA